MKNTTRPLRKTFALFAAACLAAFASPARANDLHPREFPENDPLVRVWALPMLGGTTAGPAIGIGLNASHGFVMGGFRAFASDEICIMCADSESLNQVMLLVGPKVELPFGYLALQTGVANSRGVRKENFVSNGGFFSDPQYDLVEEEGLTVPLVVDLFASTRHIGFGATWVVNVAGENPATAFFFSVPLGMIRGRTSPALP